MSGGLVEVLRDFYCGGDLDALRARMLHSTSWIQHGHTSFGEVAIERDWMSWFSVAGLSSCKHKLSVEAEGEFAEVLWLRPSEGHGVVRVGFWAWHDERHLRRVICLPDTLALAQVPERDAEELIEGFPDPDPLVICDYDQQRHPHSVEVSPLDLVNLEGETASAVSAWWSLWSRGQLSAIDEVYDPAARIELPGQQDPQSPNQLLAWCSDLFLRHQRRYCQPESALVDSQDPGRISVLWNMEADLPAEAGTRRVRISFISLLEVRGGRIQRDVLLTDTLATRKKLIGNPSA